MRELYPWYWIYYDMADDGYGGGDSGDDSGGGTTDPGSYESTSVSSDVVLSDIFSDILILPPGAYSGGTNTSSIKLNYINGGVKIEKPYVEDKSQTIEITRKEKPLFKQKTQTQATVLFTRPTVPNSTKNIFTIIFKTKPGYYYSKIPKLNINKKNYIVKQTKKVKNTKGNVTEIEFVCGTILKPNVESNPINQTVDNITISSATTRETYIPTVKKITDLKVNRCLLDADGESRMVSIHGTPGSTFSLTIKDKNNKNILPYSKTISKIVKTAASASNTIQLTNASGLEVGMILLNNQKRNVKITGISDAITTGVDSHCPDSTVYVTISSFLTLAVDEPISFVKESELTEVVIPKSGVYSFIQKFPALEKFKRTLKTAASSATSLTLDYTKDLEDDMKITGTGVDGNDPRISSSGVDPDGVTITASDAQTIGDETELTFEMPDNRYDITLYPVTAILGKNIPTYSSEDCDVMPTYSIYQYVNPVVQITPSSALSNVITTGGITLTGKVNKTSGTNGDITINMVATKSDGSLATSRNPRFSSGNSTTSDFSNTVSKISKIVRTDSCHDKDIVHLSNTTDIRVGMIVNENNNYDICNSDKLVTVKSITGTAVKLSSKQTFEKGAKLTFTSMYNMRINSLAATLSANGGLATGICTVTGTGSISTFGIDSFTSTFSFDNFLSIAT
mgnify:CR=1 FL=1